MRRAALASALALTTVSFAQSPPSKPLLPQGDLPTPRRLPSEMLGGAPPTQQPVKPQTPATAAGGVAFRMHPSGALTVTGR